MAMEAIHTETMIARKDVEPKEEAPEEVGVDLIVGQLDTETVALASSPPNIPSYLFQDTKTYVSLEVSPLIVLLQL